MRTASERALRTASERALRAVLTHAARQPGHPLPLTPSCATSADRRALLLALQAEWSRLYWARVSHLSTARSAPRRTASELAALAHAQCSCRHRVLREVLDRHAHELGTSFVATGSARPG